MPVVDIIDELFIVADPAQVRTVVCDASRWAGWLPGLTFTPYQDRGRRGIRWYVSGALSGTAEVWLEEHGDGTIVHAYLRVDPPPADPQRLRRSRRRVQSRYVLVLKRRLNETKDLLEGDRQPGTARVPISERVVSATEESQHGTRRPPGGGRSAPRAKGHG